MDERRENSLIVRVSDNLNKIPKKYKLGAVTAIAMAFVLGVILSTNATDLENIEYNEAVLTDPWDLMQYSWVEGEATRKAVEWRKQMGFEVLYMDDLNSDETKNIVRKELYMFTNKTFDNLVYKNLPEIPLDFYQKSTAYKNGLTKDPSEIGYEYYVQPEWFPSGPNCISRMHNAIREGYVTGFGETWPADIKVEGKAGETVTVMFWVRSACFSEYYQGIQLVEEYPEPTKFKGDIWKNPEGVEEYFRVSFDPGLFTLAPIYVLTPLVVSEDPWKAYWVPTFGENYTIPVTMQIKINPGTPAGTYIVGGDITKPSEEYSMDGYEEYGSLYTPTGGIFGISIGRPYVQVFLRVM